MNIEKRVIAGCLTVMMLASSPVFAQKNSKNRCCDV